METPLGGAVMAAVRMGPTVRRPVRPATAATEELLAYLDRSYGDSE